MLYECPSGLLIVMGANTKWAGWACAHPGIDLGGHWIFTHENSLGEDCPTWT